MKLEKIEHQELLRLHTYCTSHVMWAHVVQNIAAAFLKAYIGKTGGTTEPKVDEK